MKIFCSLTLAVTISVYPYEHYKWQNDSLPKDFLKEVATGVDFAFKTDAARKIDFNDLDHFHILVNQDFKGQNVLKAIKARQGILFHTQEKVNYGTESYSKRNILVRNGIAEVTYSKKGYFYFPFFITVLPEDLGFQSEEFWSTGYIIDLSGLDSRRLPTKNVITVGSRKLFIGFTKGIPPQSPEDSVNSFRAAWFRLWPH